MGSNKESTTAGKAIRCKAAICRNAGEPLIIEEIEVDPPKAWEVRIKILCTSLCHSDITFWKMKPGPLSDFPRIFGHEATGVVESVGDHVEEVKEGELVLPVFAPDCGECRDCRSTKSNICSKFSVSSGQFGMPRDGTSRFRDMKGEVLHHFLSVSSFTEYTVVDVAHMVKLSHGIPVDKASLLSCGISTGIGASWKLAGVEEGSTVAIFGLGAVGLAVAEGARLRGASKIIGVDLNPEKFELGIKFGLTDFVNPSTCGEKSVSQVIKEMTEGGADYCFECVGLASLMTEAFRSSREGWGKTVILGVEMHGSPLSLNPYELLRGKSVAGALIGGLKPKSDIPLLAEKYIDKELNLEQFITHEVSFKDINKAFELLLGGKSLRCVIWMDK
ncbi:hypothetical protein P3X46_021289 [Hevea brasiliensis]|uniref:Enoyl reductase (ER) domain-containing protein n=1 Tax=Hevea brasiliensis TaxID=3981 RepID=A0ABQ9LIM6_HEVBR|nr:alcohol dehydrogenase-like 2 isoform X1 [Hevea brasiliensis]KAJ9166551.1 hypothetical protein P3X46_021289 [Hevea brasiliensis]